MTAEEVPKEKTPTVGETSYAYDEIYNFVKWL